MDVLLSISNSIAKATIVTYALKGANTLRYHFLTIKLCIRTLHENCVNPIIAENGRQLLSPFFEKLARKVITHSLVKSTKNRVSITAVYLSTFDPNLL